MIDEIAVKNLALIREAYLVPSNGLTVLTGETGTGKTALISALKLLMGERADKTAVREGANAAQVEGRFIFGDDELIAIRRVSADGRSRATINGDMASMSELSAAISSSIDLCGQHEHQALMKPANHGGMLDAWGAESIDLARECYAKAFEEAVEANREYERVVAASAASNAQLDEARFILGKIDAVNPLEGEYEELAAQVARFEYAESLARAANVAHEALSGEGGALDGLNAAVQALTEASRYDAGLADYASSLREVGYVIEDVARDALSYRDGIDLDPEELAFKQERLAAMQGLMRAYGPRMEDVLARRAAAWDVVSLVDNAEEHERAAKRALDAAEEALAYVADVLHTARVAIAPVFAAQVTEVMGRLSMGSARLECEVSLLPRASWTKAGPSSVEFLFCPGANLTARPLAKIASGGEISRVMLAVKAIMGERDGVSTLVFDEVDAGVGGATALSLAQVVSDLARTHQVIVITHLAQLAVAADAHYVVEKSGDDDPVTNLREVAGEEREREIARMLSGSATESSLAHAREMLAAWA